MRRRNRLGNEKGVVLIVALLLLLVLTLIGISSINTTSFENIISGNERCSNLAFYCAESGIQAGLNQLPDTDPIQGTGSNTAYGTVRPMRWAQNRGDDPTMYSKKRYQINATCDSCGASAKQIEVQVSYGVLPPATGYNN